MRRVNDVMPIPDFLQPYLPGNKGSFMPRRKTDSGFQAILDAEIEKLNEGGGNTVETPVTRRP